MQKPEMPTNTGPAAARAKIHPLVVRAGHWINAVAMFVMIMSGLGIHNAYPVMPFSFPTTMTIGGGLTGALQWHLAAMWLLAVNGLVYLFHGFFSGRFRVRFAPLSIGQGLRDGLLGLRGKLSHDVSSYNGAQRLLYVGVIAVAALAVLSGLAIWKPVQFGLLTRLMGDFDTARIVHFVAMALIVLFILVHVTMALLVPRSLLAMIRGH